MSKAVINDLLTIFKSGISAVLPGILIRRSIKYDDVTQCMCILNDSYNLVNKNVYMVGTGKAVHNMAKETELILGSKLKKGIISIPVGSLDKQCGSDKVNFFEGALNNLPDEQAESTARKIQDICLKLSKEDIVIVLISGGGSALLPLPKSPITLQEKTVLIKKLANSGADIKQLNVVRKKISDIKGGKLAILAQPAQVVSLILSDIVGDPLDLIASGPTVENNDRPNDAKDIIENFKLTSELPDSIQKVLDEDDTTRVKFPKENIKNYIIGSNKMCIEAAVVKAQSLNYFPLNLSHTVTGDVKTIAQKYVKLTKIICNMMSGEITNEMASRVINSVCIPGVENNIMLNEELFKSDAVCLILGGEITVNVKGSGKGGRNQHLALEYADIVHTLKPDFDTFDINFLSAGTDGIDGPTDAAGAIVYLDLIYDAKNENFDVQKYLNSNDTYNFFNKFRDGKLLVKTGHTNTNVMDLHLILIKKKMS